MGFKGIPRRMILGSLAAAAGTFAASCSSSSLMAEFRAYADGFNPETLERGAKALREINSSPHAKQVVSLVLTLLSLSSFPIFFLSLLSPTLLSLSLLSPSSLAIFCLFILSPYDPICFSSLVSLSISLCLFPHFLDALQVFEIMRQQEEIRLTEQAVEKALFKAMEVEADIVGNRLFFSFCLKSFSLSILRISL